MKRLRAALSYTVVSNLTSLSLYQNYFISTSKKQGFLIELFTGRYLWGGG
jgi:hypothetical protein